MATVDVINANNQTVSKEELNDSVFDAPANEAIVHQVVRKQLADRRTGTASCKNRALVRGTGKKPWRQKGTGRARSGSQQSPIWRGGGVVFGPSPRDYNFKLNRKVRKAALRSVLSEKLREGQFKVVDQIELPEIRTRAMVELLGGLGLNNVLIVIPERDEVIEKSARNIPSVKVIAVEGLNVYDVLLYDSILVTKASLPKIEQKVS